MTSRPIPIYDFQYVSCRKCNGMVPPHLEESEMCVPCSRDNSEPVDKSCRICHEPLVVTCDINDLSHPRCREKGPAPSVNLSRVLKRKR